MKNLFKNMLLISLIIILPTGILFGCSSKEQSSKNPSSKEIGEKISLATNLSEMKEGDSKNLTKLYDISEEDLEDFFLLTAPSNIKADELAIIKVKDEKKIDSIKEKVEKRVENQSTSFKDYLPEEYNLIENHILEVKDKYIFLSISKDSEKAKEVFYESFK
ncbi:DUF4358 domain-containing protein [uncultured Clostridium sp.]|uniref:DUF4358 domain-containing protein n=1 Tax=uncultured Clostridium sp. TaxID=59620 RepID=UPI0028EBE209|nr:DUF4358 domain-containing protein [uncultured Clostridium sp.]